jgi:hypothetical protein
MNVRLFTFVIAISLLFAMLGCGSSDPNCLAAGIRVSPLTATADHTLVSPGNKASFYADPIPVRGCGYAQMIGSIRNATWSVSDAVNVTISNQNDSTYGVATCVNAASNVTVTATTPDGSKATATLTCR